MPVFLRFFCAVKLNGSRTVEGTLRGFDQFMNIVLDNTVEVGGKGQECGMVVIRGASIVTIECLQRVGGAGK